MKYLYFLLLMFVAIPLFSDEIYLTDYTVRKVTITNVTPDNIEYTTPENNSEKLARSLAEKIIYSSGKEIDFYDRIYIKDGSVLKGRIIKKSDDFVEYNPSGSIPFDKIEISKILKISYDDGRVESFSKSPEADQVFFKDGKISNANGIIINDKDVQFFDEKNKKQLYGRNMIEKVVYKDGNTVYMDKSNPGNDKNSPSGTMSANKSAGSFVEFELGWNGYSGLGMRFDYLLIGNLSLNGAAGLGLWGYRIGGALRYYIDYPYGLAFSLGVAHNLGMQSEEVKMNTQDSMGKIYSENVKFKLKPVTCINGSLLYSFQVNGNDKIYLETGYSYALQKEKYTYTAPNGRTLTKESKDVMNIIAPGGFMISAGYAIAF